MITHRVTKNVFSEHVDKTQRFEQKSCAPPPIKSFPYAYVRTQYCVLVLRLSVLVPKYNNYAAYCFSYSILNLLYTHNYQIGNLLFTIALFAKNSSSSHCYPSLSTDVDSENASNLQGNHVCTISSRKRGVCGQWSGLVGG